MSNGWYTNGWLGFRERFPLYFKALSDWTACLAAPSDLCPLLGGKGGTAGGDRLDAGTGASMIELVSMCGSSA